MISLTELLTVVCENSSNQHISGGAIKNNGIDNEEEKSKRWRTKIMMITAAKRA